jgi:hypothetical protein
MQEPLLYLTLLNRVFKLTHILWFKFLFKLWISCVTYSGHLQHLPYPIPYLTPYFNLHSANNVIYSDVFPILHDPQKIASTPLGEYQLYKFTFNKSSLYLNKASY